MPHDKLVATPELFRALVDQGYAQKAIFASIAAPFKASGATTPEAFSRAQRLVEQVDEWCRTGKVDDD